MRLVSSLWKKVALLALSMAAFSAGAATRPLLVSASTRQETGFLNRTVTVGKSTYRFQVYLPENYRHGRREKWPIILFLHGRGERGSEGMWQTQVGLPESIRDHPERWPFVVVMPQCPLDNYWTDGAMQQMAMAALDQESAEFEGDPSRTYLVGLSLGGYGSWELLRQHPRRWAAVSIAAGGIFWSYQPERWREQGLLPTEYARAVGRTPIWLFHGTEDPTVIPKQSELMFEALRANGGHVRLWLYQGLHHDCWTRAFNEPELPRWLLDHRLPDSKGRPEQTVYSERLTVPQHPAALKLTAQQIDGYVGEYRDANGRLTAVLYRQGDDLIERNAQGENYELAAETPNLLFYPGGSSITRVLVERGRDGRVVGLVHRDDRHEEHWERRTSGGH